MNPLKPTFSSYMFPTTGIAVRCFPARLGRYVLGPREVYTIPNKKELWLTPSKPHEGQAPPTPCS